MRVFLMADAVGWALAGQTTPNGYYNLERMLGATIRHGAEVGLCGTRRSQLEELADWTLWADRVVTF